MEPSGQQLRRLTEAIQYAYNHSSLEQFVLYTFDVQLYHQIASPTSNFEEVAFRLTQRFREYGRLEELLQGFIKDRGKNVALVSICKELLSRLADEDVSDPQVNSAPPADEYDEEVLLERIITRPRMQNLRIWCERALRVSRRVCRVEIGSQGYATGFLVGPDAVLTAYHGLAEVIQGSRLTADIEFRFDFAATPDGTVSPGVVSNLAKEWLWDYSPPGKLELTANPDAMDYVIVRLTSPIGAEPINDPLLSSNEIRGWEELPVERPVLIGEPLTILQHPFAQPLKMAVMSGAILNVVSPWLHYQNMTEPGSAGGPCFNDKLELVAMHHASLPRSEQNPDVATNVGEGVLCSAIRARLAHNDKLAALGP